MADGIPLWNTDTLLSSEPGWLGIKTGHTLAAGFCLLFAVRRTPSGGSVPVTVVGAVLGQKGSADAFGAARAAADAALARYASPASLRPVVSGVARSAWGAQVPVRLGIMHLGTETLRSGAEVALLGIPLRPGPLLRAGDTVGILEGSVDGHLVVWWDIVAGGDISAPPLQWRLAHV
jgi:D-alanyl-D-alanine carboxypeptidase (penicillin-binding protein 5/6)